MKKLMLLLSCIWLFAGPANSIGQERRAKETKEPAVSDSRRDLPDLKACMSIAQEHLPLFTENMADHSQERDVNSIIQEIEKYIDSLPKSKTYSDQLLVKYFTPLRHFFLTTTNRTTVATEFLYADAPYRFCRYGDTALTLYIWAVKDGDNYDLSKMTEKRIAKKTFENCLMPSLTALDEFKDNDIKYIAMSAYYGCKDTREGAPEGGVVPYCLTLVARTTDLQQYAAGLITAKGLMINAEVYVADVNDLRKVSVE